MPGGGEGAADAARVGNQFAVEEGQEAGLGSVARGNRWAARGDQGACGGVGGLGGVVQEELVEAVEDVGDAVLLAGQQPQPGPGEPDDDGGLGALALDVADGEAPAAVAGREEVVEVAAGAALVARFVDEGAAHAGDLGDGAGQQPALEDGADGGLAGVLAGGADGERDPAAEVLDEAGDLVREAGDAGPPDDQGAEGASAGDQPVGEGDAVGAVRAERVTGPGVGDGAGAPRVARAGRVLLQGAAQLLDVALAGVPDAGQPRAHHRAGGVAPGSPAQGLVLQPHRAPVGEPRHDQLAGEGGDQVLVELSGQQVGGLGEEGQGAAAQPLAVAAAPAGAGLPFRRRPGRGPGEARVAFRPVRLDPRGGPHHVRPVHHIRRTHHARRAGRTHHARRVRRLGHPGGLRRLPVSAPAARSRAQTVLVPGR